MVVKQTNIGYIKDPKYPYFLDLKDEWLIMAKAVKFHLEEEAWLDAHLDELTAKGVITLIIPHEELNCITALLLEPGQ